MLTIKFEENPKKALEQMGVVAPSDSLVMTMCDGNVIMGLGIVRMMREYAEICDIHIAEEFRDFSLSYGMGKSLLNAVDLRGIKHVYTDMADSEPLLRALKFKKTEDIEDKCLEEMEKHLYYLNLTGYFDANC